MSLEAFKQIPLGPEDYEALMSANPAELEEALRANSQDPNTVQVLGGIAHVNATNALRPGQWSPTTAVAFSNVEAIAQSMPRRVHE